MANNRMFLVNRRNGDWLTLAKFYPDTGWYTYPGIESKLDAFFEANRPPPTMFGDEDYEIEYEDAHDPKRKIMEEIVKVLK